MYTYKRVRVSAPLTEWNERFVLSIDNHEEIMEALTHFCKKQKIKAGEVSGLGAVSEATFRFLDPAMFGDIRAIEKDGEPYLHVHLTCSRRDYTCVGGHLLNARINGACELLVTDFGLTRLKRRFDGQTGLNLYDF